VAVSVRVVVKPSGGGQTVTDAKATVELRDRTGPTVAPDVVLPFCPSAPAVSGTLDTYGTNPLGTLAGAPNGWTHLLDTDWSSQSIVAGLTDDRAWRISKTGTFSRRYHLRSNDAASESTVQEVVPLCRYVSFDSWHRQTVTILAAQSNGDCYFVRQPHADATTSGFDGQLELFSFVGGTATLLATVDLVTSLDARQVVDRWVWFRFRRDGDRLRARTWGYGNPDPCDWQIDYTVSSPLAAGRPGFGARKSSGNGTTVEFDQVGWAVGDASAPGPWV
jgi:hypothetical protein